jgi:hypothetical protein
MRSWGYLAAAIYALALAALCPLIAMAAFAPSLDVVKAAEQWTQWQLWAVVLVMGLAQAAFLVVPVRVASRRPTSRATLLAPIVVSGLMAGLLAVGLGYSIAEFAWGAHAPNEAVWVPFLVGGVLWLGWAVYFWRFSAARAPDEVMRVQCRSLLKGSVMELLVAVPTHVVARYRDYCCAGLMTFVGLACGLAVMLFAFGPGVFFLYVERWRRLHPKADAAA